MSAARFNRPLSIILLLVTIATGCNRSFVSTWSTGTKTALQNERMCQVCLNDGKTFCVVLTQDCSGGTLGTSPGANFNGEIRLANREKLRWHAQPKEEQPGDVIIDDATFNLANGGWFVVSADGQVLQFKADMSGLDKVEPKEIFAHLEQMAQRNAEIAHFLRDVPQPDEKAKQEVFKAEKE